MRKAEVIALLPSFAAISFFTEFFNDLPPPFYLRIGRAYGPTGEVEYSKGILDFRVPVHLSRKQKP